MSVQTLAWRSTVGWVTLVSHCGTEDIMHLVYGDAGLNLYILTFSDFERGSSLFPKQEV